MIDKTGSVVFPFYIESSELRRLNSEGLAYVSKGGKYGIIDANGNLISDYLFSSIEPFHDGYAFFTEDTSFGTKYGVVSKSGQITVRFLNCSPVYIIKRIHWGARDMWIETKPTTTFFSEGLAAVRRNNKWGYINPQGEVVIDFQFNTAFEVLGYGHSSERPGAGAFYNGRAMVHFGGKWNFIDKQGNFILDESYDSIQSAGVYYICQSDDGALKIIRSKDWETVLIGENGTVTDASGTIVLQYDGNSVKHYRENLFYYKLNGKLGVFSLTEPPQQHPTISVICNGNLIDFDQPPIMENDRVLVPMRAIFEALGADVAWDGETQTITAVREDDCIVLQIGSDKMFVNDREIQLDVPAKLVNGRTLVPIRAISEALGANVEWDEGLQQVVITI